MTNNVKQFIRVRNYTAKYVNKICDIYFFEIHDPLIQYNLIREVKLSIKKDILLKYPKLPTSIFPNIKIQVCDDEIENEYVQSIEITVQEYLNPDSSLTFLGNATYKNKSHDLYYKKSWDPYFPYTFYNRYGHDENMFSKASKQAYDEYVAEKTTPLSIAFQMAFEEGYILPEK